MGAVVVRSVTTGEGKWNSVDEVSENFGVASLGSEAHR
jgi:hypothetical protein